MIMPFGRHRGKRLEDIPASYLRWAIENCSSASPALLAEMRRVLRASEDSAPSPLALPTLAAKWYRTLAAEFHPDKRSGSHEGMLAINRARDLLCEMIGGAT